MEKMDNNINEDNLEDFFSDGEEYPTITMFDEDGKEVEFSIVSSIVNDGVNYLLVTESSLLDDDEAEATVLKEVTEEGEESFYEIVSDDAEFEKCVELFKNCNDDFDIEL